MKKKNVENIKGKKHKKRGLKIFLVILIILIIFSVAFAYKVHKNGGGLGGVVATTLGHDENTVTNLETVYCVLLGQSQNLTDTIMLAAYDPKTQQASLLSIPRDTFIGKNKATATAYSKINALCQYDNPEKTVAAVAQITGIDVTNYILVDTKALVEIVDLIGGVWFDVPIDMKYTDKKQNLYIDLKAGYQLLNGTQSEGVVRFRHNQDGTTYPAEYGTQDLGRTRTQREFLKVLAKQTLSPSNLLKIGGMLDVAYENVKTNVSLSDIKDYIPYMLEFNFDLLQTGTVPGKSELCNSLWFYVQDKEETEKVVEELFGSIDELKSQEKQENAKYTIQIFDGTNKLNSTKAEEAKEILESKGYTVLDIEKTTALTKTTIIDRTNSTEVASKIKSALGDRGTIVSGKAAENVSITIIVGEDM